MNRHQSRENAMIVIYQFLLIGLDIEKSIDNYSHFEDCSFFNQLARNTVHNLDFLKESLSRHLKDWDFDRLNYVEQAILLVATCELRLEEVEKAVVINEAVELSKKYCDDNSYRFINGVLDQL